MTGSILSLILPVIIGWQIICLVSKEFHLKFKHSEFFFVSTIFGFVLTSHCYIITNFFSKSILIPEIMISLALLLIQLQTQAFKIWFTESDDYRNIALVILILIPCCLNIIVQYNIMGDEGGWDALAFWRARAKLMLLDPSCFFTDKAAVIPHLEYPPLYSAFIARLWTLGLSLSSRFILYSQFFCLTASAYFLYLIVRLKTDKNMAIIAVLVLSMCMEWRINIASGLVDCWLGLMTLISIYYITRYTQSKENIYFHMAIVFAGIASLLKNEGILYLTIFSIISIKFIDTKLLRGSLFIGITFILIALFWKYFILSNTGFHLDNDLLLPNAMHYTTLFKLFDLDRHFIIWGWIGSFITHRNLLTNFSLYLLLIFGGSLKVLFSTYRYYMYLILSQVVIFYLIFLLTSWDLLTYLNAAAHRLYVQLLPSCIAIVCMLSNWKKPENS